VLQDLVSYNGKHNEANGEDNRDGASDNNSWNCGSEGPTDDPGVVALRERQKRNLIATLLLSQGVPMLLAGDELGHTQQGNNNTYCQDNELTWLEWDLDARREQFLVFVRAVIQVWKTQPVFQRRKFFQGRAIRGTDVKDISWFAPDGQEMSDEGWNAGFVKCLGVRLAGDLIGDLDDRGEPLVGDTLLLLFNAHDESIPFALPATRAEHWDRILDTAEPEEDRAAFAPGDRYPLQGRALVLLRTQAIAQATPPAEDDAGRDVEPSVAQEAAPVATGVSAD
jgi:glycogen operon protein